MVYTGRPSAGCENCRKSKKRCDQGLPACGRCVRLGRACGGYRDLADLMFRDLTESVTRRESAATDAGIPSALPTRQPSPERETVARQFFFAQFVTASHLSFLEGVSPDVFLMKPIMACATAAMANRGDDPAGRELARRYYVQAIVATNEALRHPRRVKEDNTLVAVCLLSLFERLAWERNASKDSWMHHVEGSARVLELRGRNQIRTRTGTLIFRELRNNIVVSALFAETEVPEFIVHWTQALEYDPLHTPSDQLTVLSARTASVKEAFRTGTKLDSELSQLAEGLEKDLLAWSETTLASGSICSFHNVRDLDSPHSWNGSRHEYGIPLAHSHWNHWRSLRILLSRTREAIWRRSWPTLIQPSLPVPNAEEYKAIRNRMVSDICMATAYAFGNDASAEPPLGAVSSGYLLINPLCLAGTCLLEQLSQPLTSPGGSRRIHVDSPLHTTLFDQTSTQLAWLIERVDYIADKVGIRWAGFVSKFLKGESGLWFDLERSNIVNDEYLGAEFHYSPGEPVSLLQLSDLEGMEMEEM